MKRILLPLALSALTLGVMGCEKQGPLERAGEEVDEAVDTMKNGRESTSNKADDAIDELRKGASEAKKEVTN